MHAIRLPRHRQRDTHTFSLAAIAQPPLPPLKLARLPPLFLFGSRDSNRRARQNATDAPFSLFLSLGFFPSEEGKTSLPFFDRGPCLCLDPASFAAFFEFQKQLLTHSTHSGQPGERIGGVASDNLYRSSSSKDRIIQQLHPSHPSTHKDPLLASTLNLGKARLVVLRRQLTRESKTRTDEAVSALFFFGPSGSITQLAVTLPRPITHSQHHIHIYSHAHTFSPALAFATDLFRCQPFDLQKKTRRSYISRRTGILFPPPSLHNTLRTTFDPLLSPSTCVVSSILKPRIMVQRSSFW